MIEVVCDGGCEGGGVVRYGGGKEFGSCALVVGREAMGRADVVYE